MFIQNNRFFQYLYTIVPFLQVNNFFRRCIKIKYIDKNNFRVLVDGILRHPVEKWWTVSIDSRTVWEIDRTAGALGYSRNTSVISTIVHCSKDSAPCIRKTWEDIAVFSKTKFDMRLLNLKFL